MSIKRYQKWRDEQGKPFIPVSMKGQELLTDRILNKGTAFSKEERETFHLEGLIPPRIASFEDQKARVYEGFCAASTDIDKYIYLRSLQDRNETLFYGLLEEHIEEMIPIIYIPTVAIACQQFSHHYQRTRGVYITPDNVDQMGDMVNHFPSEDIRVIVTTDSQGILGIGDTGVGGMPVPIGKLSIYTLGAGIHPSYCLPIALDIGTDNEELLKDPLYLGVGHKRIKGKEYDDFIEKFVKNIRQHFPKAILQWEDFSKQHSFKILEKYREYLPSYNDDIQSTGAVVMAGVLNSVKAKNEKLSDQVFTIFGMGSGGGGFASELKRGLIAEGMTEADALNRIFTIDSKGLVTTDRDDIQDFKRPFAVSPDRISSWKIRGDKPSLLEIIENSGTTVLVGISGVKGAFGQNEIKALAKNTERPVVFPLTNPVSESEATPEHIYEWTNGKAIVAIGSSYHDIEFNGKPVRIGQASNTFIFPGIGLAAMISKINVIPDEIFTVAAQTLSNCVPVTDLNDGTLYPKMNDIQRVAVRIAIDALKYIQEKNPHLGLKIDEIHEIVRSNVWKPAYYPYKNV